jgi:S1-C subfamily serine protease
MPADDDEASGPPPHPLDRVWFHPSELGAPATALRPQPAAPRVWVAAALALLVGIMGTLGVVSVVGTFTGNGDNTNRLQRATTTPFVDPGRIASLVQSTGQSIVTISVVPADGGTATAAGSGVAVGEDKGGIIILTAAHLLADRAAVSVVSVGGQVTKATLVGDDPQTDLALLRVEGVELTLAQLSTGTGSTSLRSGDAVLAVGTGSGTHRPVSTGVISDFNQFVTYPSGVVGAAMVRTDAKAESPMVAGGALVDVETGGVIGILTVDGAAVPIDIARDVARQLAATGEAVHGWLGVVGDTAFDRQGGGVRVQSVVADSPAASSIDLIGTPALMPGDVIMAVGDVDVASREDLVAAVRRLKPKDPVDLTIVRGDKVSHVQVPALGASQPLAADLAVVA